MVNICQPTIHDVIGFIDSVFFSCRYTDLLMTQNCGKALYCTYDCNTLDNSVFVCELDGKIFLCVKKFSGS